MATDNYDIANAISRTEERLINDLIKQLKKKSSIEMIEKGEVDLWKLDQLKALREYKKRNSKYFTQENYDELLERISIELEKQYETGGEETRKQIENAIKNGFENYTEPSDALSTSFTGVNDRKLQALINETTSSIFKAEYAALRYADDSYRKIIFDAHTYFQTGSGTLAQAIDMATKDFLSAGINCVEYKDGRKVNIQSYSEMALRTANKRAYMQGEAGMRDEYDIDLVIVTRRGNACPKCMQYVGKVFIDDVYGNGKANGKYPLLSSAIAGGLYHPNCRDIHTTYFEGITTLRPEPTEKEKQEANRIYQLEQHQRYLERNVRKYDRLYKGSIDETNKEKYKKLRHEWAERTKEFVDSHDELRRRYYREKAITLPKDVTNKTVPEVVKMKDIPILKSQMGETDFNEFKTVVDKNETLSKIFNKYGEQGTTYELTKYSGVYKYKENKIVFSYPTYHDMNKYETLSHEFGHMVDRKSANDINLHYTEIDKINKNLKYASGASIDYIKRTPSQSDEFLTAMRADKELLKKQLETDDFVKDLKSSNASSGIQDLMGGLFKTRKNGILPWGHDEKYYNRFYNTYIYNSYMKDTLKTTLIELGKDASNQTKVKDICREYETASEVWANAFSAICVGGDELKYFEKYCPNIIKTMRDILKGVE